jgi:hypothetical protein
MASPITSDMVIVLLSLLVWFSFWVKNEDNSHF